MQRKGQPIKLFSSSWCFRNRKNERDRQNITKNTSNKELNITRVKNKDCKREEHGSPEFTRGFYFFFLQKIEHFHYWKKTIYVFKTSYNFHFQNTIFLSFQQELHSVSPRAPSVSPNGLPTLTTQFNKKYDDWTLCFNKEDC